MRGNRNSVWAMFHRYWLIQYPFVRYLLRPKILFHKDHGIWELSLQITINGFELRRYSAGLLGAVDGEESSG